MMQGVAIVEQAEQQGADRSLAGLVPAKSGYHALAGPALFHFDHGALARLIRALCRLRDPAIKPGTLEALEPLCGARAIACHRCQVYRRPNILQQPLETSAPLALRCGHQADAIGGEEIERHE